MDVDGTMTRTAWMFMQAIVSRERPQLPRLVRSAGPKPPSDHLVLFTGQLRLAVAAYLARFKGRLLR